jgi:four helix bundle protein
METNSERHAIWERRQTELWDRVFQVTQDVVTLVETIEGSAGISAVRDELVRASMAVGAELVRANASDSAGTFEKHVKGARLKAVEADYWLRLIYVLQQEENVQRDLSGVISQYSAIVTLLQKFIRHTQTEPSVVKRHTKGPWVN